MIEIVDERVHELEVRRTDFIGLKEVVERLASAQAGTEKALKEFAERTDQSIQQLAGRMEELGPRRGRPISP